MVDPQVREAIESRKAMGYSEEQITTDFVAAGYTQEQMAAILKKLSETPVAVPEPSQSMAMSTVVPKKKRSLLIIVGIVLTVLSIALLITWFFVSDGVSALSRLLSSAPYQTEAELIENVFATTEQTNAYGFNMEYQFAVEERTDEAVELSEAVLGETVSSFLAPAASSLDTFPREIDARFFASGLIDVRNTENPAIDVSAQVNVVAEPLLFSGAGSARLVDGVGYGRIDDFPENMKPYLEGVPVETWIILGTEDDVVVPNVPFVPVQSVEAVRSAVELYAEAMPPEFFVALASLATTTNRERSVGSVSQLAQLAAPLLEQSSEAESMAELRAQIESQLVQFPPIMFVGEPEKVDWFDESVYRYELDINSTNIRELILAAAKEAGADITPEAEAELDEMFVDIERGIETVNALVSFVSYVRADGTSAGFSLDSVVALPAEFGFEPQFALRMKTYQTVQNDGLEIVAPADVHPLTLEEIEAEQRKNRYPGLMVPGAPGGARGSALDAATMQSMSSIRVQAEISWAAYGNYAAVCTDDSVSLSLQSVADTAAVKIQQDAESSTLHVVCNDSEDAYAVAAPLLSSPDLYCVDSTGFAGEVPYVALAESNDYRCESESISFNEVSLLLQRTGAYATGISELRIYKNPLEMNDATVHVSGVAATREELVSLQNAFERIEQVFIVRLPIDQLSHSSDLRFEMEVVMNDPVVIQAQ